MVMNPPELAALSPLLTKLAEECHERSCANGFWESSTADAPTATLEAATKIGLIGSEVSEVLEAWREAEPFGPCAKDPRLSKVDEEMADVFIRLLDLAHFLGCDLGQAVALKMAYNANRPYKHSKRF